MISCEVLCRISTAGCIVLDPDRICMYLRRATCMMCYNKTCSSILHQYLSMCIHYENKITEKKGFQQSLPFQWWFRWYYPNNGLNKQRNNHWNNHWNTNDHWNSSFSGNFSDIFLIVILLINGKWANIKIIKCHRKSNSIMKLRGHEICWFLSTFDAKINYLYRRRNLVWRSTWKLLDRDYSYMGADFDLKWNIIGYLIISNRRDDRFSWHRVKPQQRQLAIKQ